MRKFILMLLPILMLCGCGQKEEKKCRLTSTYTHYGNCC